MFCTRFASSAVLAPRAYVRLVVPSASRTIQRYASVEKQDQRAAKAAVEVKKEIIQEHAKNIAPEEHESGSKPSVQYSDAEYNMPHPIWQNEYVYRIENTHLPTKNTVDVLAKATISAIRFNFDWMSGWMFGKKTVNKALVRIIFLETVAGVPGSIAGILRHLASLRRLRRDNGWIHTLFEEAENERMHLLTYMTKKQASAPFRGLVWLTQGIFFNFFFVAYMLSPRFCHRLVGYLEEQAVLTYTHILDGIDNNEGDLGLWKTEPAPEIAIKYWHLPQNATMRDVVAVTRADEAHHRDVNHAFASMQPTDPNPFRPGF